MISNFIFKTISFSKVNAPKFSTLVLAEHANGKLKQSTYKILNAATQLQEPVHLLITGQNLKGVQENVQKTISDKLVSKVLVADNILAQNYTSDVISSIVKGLIEQNQYKYVISDASTLGRDVLPRVAASFDSQPISEIIAVIDQETFKRPVYAGNAFSIVQTTDAIKFLSFRPTAFEEVAPTGTVNSFENVNVDQLVKDKTNLIKHVKETLVKNERPELTSARIVVSGGKAMKSMENFKLIQELANAFGDAAIGASRAAVDAGYANNDLQVGQTGKIVAPDLYVAVGISGAIQHVAGMKDSKVIVSINKDQEAPIFEISNYGLVDDLFKVLPELTEKLKKLK